MSALSQLNPIRAFEAVARHGSYARAARELNVTPAAVGQQVRALEAWLGQKLFHRSESGPSRLSLTERARSAANEFKAGFESIERGVAYVREPPGMAVSVSASTAFVGKWLLPRLTRFSRAHPELEVHLNVNDRTVDFQRGEADVGIRCGPGGWPGVLATRILREEVHPVCAPALLRGRDPAKAFVDFDMPILRDRMMEATGGFPSWAEWFAAAGTKATFIDRGLVVDSSLAAIEAAIAGHGVLLGRRVLVNDDVRRGLLVPLGRGGALRAAWAYYLVRTRAADATPRVEAFVSWIRRECRRRTR